MHAATRATEQFVVAPPRATTTRIVKRCTVGLLKGISAATAVLAVAALAVPILSPASGMALFPMVDHERRPITPFYTQGSEPITPARELFAVYGPWLAAAGIAIALAAAITTWSITRDRYTAELGAP